MIVKVNTNGLDLKPIFTMDDPPFDETSKRIIKTILQNKLVWVWCAKGIHMDHVPNLRHDKRAGEILCIECGMVFASGTYGQK